MQTFLHRAQNFRQGLHSPRNRHGHIVRGYECQPVPLLAEVWGLQQQMHSRHNENCDAQ